MVRVSGDVILVRDDRRLAVLRTSRTVQVIAVQPNPSAAEKSPRMMFVEWLGRNWFVEIDVLCDPVAYLSDTPYCWEGKAPRA